MPRVLIATNEPNFTLGLVEGYRELGWEVVMGTLNFRIRAAHYDLVHHQWPEEFTGWAVPSSHQVAEVREHLQWWETRTVNVFSVNNLYPHQCEGNPAFHELYSCFYEHCQLVTHYSETSRKLVLENFPVARETQHVIHLPANYEVTLVRQRTRGSRRSEMGLGEREFVILMLGSLRDWAEIRLLQKAFDLAKIPNKRLLMAGKVKLNDTWWNKRWKNLLFTTWLKTRKAVVDTRYVPEEDISQFIDSCDVAVVPRLSGLSSAIPSLAMTFGRVFVAPRHGAYPDYVAGTRNLLYETGSPASFARALEQAAMLNLEDIGRENAAIAATWTWKRMVMKCIEAAAKLESAAADPIRRFLATARKDGKAE